MGHRRKRKKQAIWKKILLVLVLSWFVLEGRFYIPKRIRPPEGLQPVEVEMTTTSYCHCRKCCSYKWFLFVPYQKTGFMDFRLKHVGKTSSGAMVRPGSIAADTSIYPYGTVMYIPGYGYGRVEDTGGAIKGRHIDLYRPNHWFARKWGVRTKKVKVWLPAPGRSWSFDPSGPVMQVSAKLPSAGRAADERQPPMEPPSTNGIPLPLGLDATNGAASEIEASTTNNIHAADGAGSANESLPQIPLP